MEISEAFASRKLTVYKSTFHPPTRGQPPLHSQYAYLDEKSPPGIDQGVLSLTAALPVPLSSLSAVAIQSAWSSLFFWLQVEVNASNKEPRRLRCNQIKPV
ncbi:unnamed protein product [Tetraodon nigroviridis]|uniref:(spotted green pufferfish) hypothetical protein n=1 Tax=Tetraodon nigroviridis TaxID=99883 RepID=Q4SCK6_TETNG|nr:unnamed protein product [Tetraodon nigroviridis]